MLAYLILRSYSDQLSLEDMLEIAYLYDRIQELPEDKQAEFMAFMDEAIQKDKDNSNAEIEKITYILQGLTDLEVGTVEDSKQLTINQN